MRNPNICLTGLNDKRMEVLLKQEMAEHQAVISSHHKEMQTLRDALKNAMERFDSLFKHSEDELSKKSSQFTHLIAELQEKVRNQEFFSSEQKEKNLSLHQELNNFYSVFAKKIDLDYCKKELQSLVKEATTSHLNAFQYCEQQLKLLVNSLKDDLARLKIEMAEKIYQLDGKIESKFSNSQLDKEGVLKEIRIYERTILVIEKKIENIYTLIERINKKGEVCRKLE